MPPVPDAEILELLAESENARNEVESAIAKLDDLAGKQLQTIRELKQKCREYLVKFQTVRENASRLVTDSALLKESFDRVRGFTVELNEYADQIESWNDDVVGILEQVDGSVDSALETGIEEVNERVEDEFESIENFTSDAVDRTAAQTNDLIETVEEKRDGAFETLDELLSANVPALLENETGEFVATVDGLREKGLSEIEKISEMLEQITDKTEAVTDLIETARPVLDLARQVL